jgi:hypothetical protein
MGSSRFVKMLKQLLKNVEIGGRKLKIIFKLLKKVCWLGIYGMGDIVFFFIYYIF